MVNFVKAMGKKMNKVGMDQNRGVGVIKKNVNESWSKAFHFKD